MNRSTVKEDLYELHHVPGSNGFWKKIRAELIEPAPKEPTPQPQGFPPINVSENRHTNMVAKPHAPGYHGDCQTPPKGLPPISTDQTKHLGWTTRPPNYNDSNQLAYKMPDIQKQQGGVLERYKHTNPIPLHRGMVEAVEEPTARKIEKRKRVDDAINRVNKSYVIDPRTYQEPDINERLDSKFIPAPPTCQKPQKHRKHNVVIVDPEKMLRERNHMRGDFATSRPPAHVPESCHSRLAAQIAAPIIGHESTTSKNAHESHIDHNPTSANSYAAPSVRSGVLSYNQRYAYGQSAADTHRVCQQPGEVYDNRVVAQTCELHHSNGLTTSNNSYGSQNVAHISISMHNNSAAPAVHSGVSPYNQRYAYGQSAADYYRTCPQQDDVFASDQAYELHHDSTNNGNMEKKFSGQAYGEGSGYFDSGSVSTQAEIDLDAKRQQMLARKCIEKREKEAALKKEEQAKNKAGSTVKLVGQISHVYQPAPPTTSRPYNNAIIEAKVTDHPRNSQHQIQIPRYAKHTHAPTIRVEPQLTWNTSAAKRGLGFKSKLRREQEEAAKQNKVPDFNDAKRGATPSTPKLSQEARRRWMNKTIIS